MFPIGLVDVIEESLFRQFKCDATTHRLPIWQFMASLIFP
jgi:hypothetical protein